MTGISFRPGLVEEYADLEVFSATIGRQLLERGLIDEIGLHIAPVLLGDGIRLFDNSGGRPRPTRAAQRR